MSTFEPGKNLPDSYADRILSVATVAFGDGERIHVETDNGTYNVSVNFATGGYTTDGSDSYDSQEEAFVALMREVYRNAF